jgi:hypothetical protein
MTMSSFDGKFSRSLSSASLLKFSVPYHYALTISMNSYKPLGRTFILLYTKFMIICVLYDMYSTDIKVEVLFLCW